MIKRILQYTVLSFFFLIPTNILAADLDITCYENQKPSVTKNTNPLFNLTNFSAGDSTTRTIYVKNVASTSDCKIYFDISGTTNTLTDKINVYIPNLFDNTLSKYITGEKILMANLQSNQETTQSISMTLPTDADNSYTQKQASFDITIQSEWGSESGNIAGLSDNNQSKTILNQIPETLGIGGGDEEIQNNNKLEEVTEDDSEVLSEEDISTCTNKTLWWIPLVIQLLLTIVLINLENQNRNIKLLISILLAITSYLAINKIGCGCNPIWICNNHYILNLAICILPLLLYFERKRNTQNKLEDTK